MGCCCSQWGVSWVEFCQLSELGLRSWGCALLQGNWLMYLIAEVPASALSCCSVFALSAGTCQDVVRSGFLVQTNN